MDGNYIDSISHLSPLTIADRKSIAKGMMHHQHRPFRNIRLKHAHVIRDEVGLNVGNKRVKLLRYAYDWAVEQELMAENPVRAAKTRSNPTEGHTSWTPDDVATFIDRHPLPRPTLPCRSSRIAEAPAYQTLLDLAR